jgi:hypothetical protein
MGMSVYFLQRNEGAAVEGPVGQGRLATEMRAGSLSEDALVCAPGTEVWMRAGDALGWLMEEMESRESRRPARSGAVLAQKVVRRPYWWASLFLALLGLGLLLFLPFAGLGLLVLAGLMDRPRWICGNCGNGVEKSSLLCPTCRAELTKKARR